MNRLTTRLGQALRRTREEGECVADLIAIGCPAGHLGAIVDAREGHPGQGRRGDGKFGGTVLKTSLSKDNEKELQEALRRQEATQ